VVSTETNLNVLTYIKIYREDYATLIESFDTSSNDDRVTVTVANTKGASFFEHFETSPPNAGEINVNLYAKFFLSHSVPKNGTIYLLSLPVSLN
jgi:hypothetical protein